MSYPVLYLDFDGVLQHEEVWFSPKQGIYIPQHLAPGHTLFEWMPCLENVLTDYPRVRIVLSTSWVRKRSYSFAKKQLLRGLQERVVGATFHNRYHRKDDFFHTPRGHQILDDVERRHPSSWIAVDDDAEGWPPWCIDNLVRCDGTRGLSDPPTLKVLRQKLAKLQ